MENGYEFSTILIQELWLNETSDLRLYQIVGFNLISQGCICSSHSGLAIYVNRKMSYTILPIEIESKFCEGLF